MFAEIEPRRRVLLECPVSDAVIVGVTVLDSGRPGTSGCAAMIIPHGREAEWVFSSEGGQRQLLNSSGSARIVLVSRKSPLEDEELQRAVTPLMTALAPRACFAGGQPPVVPFVCYEDNVAWRRVVERASSPLTGDILVEDVRLAGEAENKLRRRLVFKNTPNLIQTEVLLGEDGEPDHEQLVHVYLAPLLAGLSLVFSPGEALKILCVGIGGGALPMFLSKHLGARVVAVDPDGVVVELARRHFGLSTSGGTSNLEVLVEDGLATVGRIAASIRGGTGAEEDPRVHAIMVDVTEGSAGEELSSPPHVFLEEGFLAAARLALHEGGVLAMNVMPTGGEAVHTGVLDSLAAAFQQVYELPVCDGDNYAVFALPSPAADTLVVPLPQGKVDAGLVAQLHRVR